MLFGACGAIRLPGQLSSGPALSANVRVSEVRAQTVPGNCCFYLKGAAADVAFALPSNLSAVIDLGGGTVSQVPGTTRGLSTITLLAGPRYTVPVRRFRIAGQALFGAVRGFDADFTTGSRPGDTATAFGMALGGFAEYQLTRSITLRWAQVDYLQTNLPNGADNRQRNVRLAAGLTFAIHLPSSRH